MTIQCAVCKLKCVKGVIRSFHSLPKKEPRRSCWITFIRLHCGLNWMISKQVTYVCSDHFIAEDYSHGTKRKFLKEDVSPTVFNEEYKEMENIDARSSGKTRHVESMPSCVPTTQKDPPGCDFRPPIFEVPPLAERSGDVVEPENLISQKDELDSPPEKRSKVEFSKKLFSASTGNSNNNAFIIDSSQLTEKANISLQRQRQNLKKLYLLQQQQLLNLEQCQPLNKTDTARLKQMKNNFSTLQERIVNWVFFATQEEFEISVEEDAQVLKFVQSNYLLLQATNKILRTAATCREKNVADLKEKVKNTVEYYNAEGEKLKLKVQALEEQNRELKRKLSEKDQDLKASKNSLSLEVEKTINRILHVEKAKLDNHLSNSIKSQATLEEKLSNSEKMLRRAWEERKADKKIINSMAKQLWSKDKTVKRLQELEKDYKLRIRKMKSGNDNLFLHQQSANDYKLVKVEFLSLPHTPPATADASNDPRQDVNDEHSVNPELLGPEETAHRL